MAIKPKLEFYKFSLNHKDELSKTFRDFAVDEFGCASDISNDDVFMLCFGHFMKTLNAGHAPNKKKKKTMTYISDIKKNPYADYGPVPNTPANIVSGVINGGFYDKEAIVSNIFDKDDNAELHKDRSVLFPYYMFLYFPVDHFEGFFMIHSYSREDSITDVFRQYVSDCFSGINYNAARLSVFCPQGFQDDYRKDAVIKEMNFSTTVLNSSISNTPIFQVLNGYKVEIKISAIKNSDKEKPGLGEMEKVWTGLKSLIGFKKDEKTNLAIDEFENKKVVAEQKAGAKRPKTFALNNVSDEFVPVVHLEDQGIPINNGVPDFVKLKEYCLKLFKEEIQKEIRPDLYVTKSN